MSPQADGSGLTLPSMKVSGGKGLPTFFHLEFCCLLGSSWGLWDAHGEGKKAGGTRVWELENQIHFRLANCGRPQGSWAMPFGPGFDIYRFALALWVCDLSLKLFLYEFILAGLRHS